MYLFTTPKNVTAIPCEMQNLGRKRNVFGQITAHSLFIQLVCSRFRWTNLTLDSVQKLLFRLSFPLSL